MALNAYADDDDVFPERPHLPPAPVHRHPAPTPTPEAPKTEPKPGPYRVQAGDSLAISVWKETDLQAEVIVRPDGGFSFPLAGDIAAADHTIDEIRAVLSDRLSKFITDPVVTVALKQTTGNRVYVVGKVNKPGEFLIAGPTDVMQAISLAGGATPFASLNDIRIIRRDEGEQKAIPFRYHDVEDGRRLEQNIVLHSGDTVVVP
jgi:polysaccharide export outer membrane protein